MRHGIDACFIDTKHCRNMSPPGEDGTMRIVDVQAKKNSYKNTSAPRRSDARNMSPSQPTKTTFTFALKPMCTPPFVHSMTCNEGLNLVVDLNPSGPSFAQVLESNIRKTVENYEFESFHGEIQFLETKQKKLLEFSEMDMPMPENKTLPHSSRDHVMANHDLRSSDAPAILAIQISSDSDAPAIPPMQISSEAQAIPATQISYDAQAIPAMQISSDAPAIPAMQISGTDFQKKGTSVSFKDSAQAMANENVAVAVAGSSEVNNNGLSKLTSAEEMHGCVNDKKALAEMENHSDKTCKGKRRGKGYLKKYNKVDDGIQKNKRTRFKGSSSKEVHHPKGA